MTPNAGQRDGAFSFTGQNSPSRASGIQGIRRSPRCRVSGERRNCFCGGIQRSRLARRNESSCGLSRPAGKGRWKERRQCRVNHRPQIRNGKRMKRKKLTVAQKRERRREYQRRYNASPKGKESRRRFFRSFKGREYIRRCNQSPKGKERWRRFDQSPKGREARRRGNQSPKGKERQRRYDQSDKGKECRCRFEQSPKRREAQHRGDARLRLRRKIEALAWKYTQRGLDFLLKAQS